MEVSVSPVIISGPDKSISRVINLIEVKQISSH